MVSNGLLQEFTQRLLKHGASLDDIIGMVYTKEELDPLTGKFRKYFILTKKILQNNDKFQEGYIYKIRYKIDLAGNKIPQGKATYTTKTAELNEAVKLGFDNRLEILKNYELNKDKPKNGKEFYRMLSDYYQDNSKYLHDDTVSNKREIVYSERKKAQTFIKDDLVPFLVEKKINHISEITTSVYSNFKIYLQAKGIKDKTINNRLSYFIRILEHHSRNGLLEKLPYTKGTAILRLNGKQEKDDAEIFPIKKLKGIYPHIKLIDPINIINYLDFLTENKIKFLELNVKEQEKIFNNYILPFTLGALSLNTGMRNSELARIKREDFIPVPIKKTFLLKIWNNKTDYFNKTSESKYRKIPLHAFTIEALKIFIKRKEEIYGEIKDTDFIFGKAEINKDTGETDGHLDAKIFNRAVLFFLKLMKLQCNFSDFFITINDLLNLPGYKALQEELKETSKGISFYSFRKTFRTMLGLKNDLAEYYMGHKLGDNSKTTYIQVNSMDNDLFVDAYAEPVISMLNKYIFYTEDELKNIYGKLNKKRINRLIFFRERKNQGASLYDILEEYKDKKYEEGFFDSENNPSENICYFNKM